MEKFRNLVRHTSFGAYVLFTATALLMILGAGLIVHLLGMYVGRIGYEVVLILGAAFYWRYAVGAAAADWPDLRRSGLTFWGVVCVVLGAVVWGLWSNAMMAFLVDTFPGTFQRSAEVYQQQMREFLLEASGTEWALAVVGVTIAAPICEEALFRGTILMEQQKSHRMWVAVAINGVLFGVFHIVPLLILPLSVVGAFLAHITIRSESLWPPILAHFAMNFFNGVVLPFLVGNSAEAIETSAATRMMSGQGATAGEYALTLGGLGAVGALFWWGAVRALEARESATTA